MNRGGDGKLEGEGCRIVSLVLQPFLVSSRNAPPPLCVTILKTAARETRCRRAANPTVGIIRLD